MKYPIKNVEGIGMVYATQLAQASISNTEHLLKLCYDRTGRKNVSKATGLRESQLLKWANLADLMRITGIGPQFAELLEAAGVDTVKELKTRRADKLAARIADVNEDKRLTGAIPSQGAVQRWIDGAKLVEPTIKH